MSTNTPQNLTNAVFRGLTFIGGQTVLGKLISLVSQYALSWLLLPADFGLVSLAYTVSILSGLTMQIGLREFIVRRRRSDLWIEPAIFVALLLSSLGAILMCMVAHLAASLYHEPRVFGLILVLAISQPISGVNAVVSAVLQKRLRFAELVTAGLLNTLLVAALSIVLAARGFGAYSFAIPVPIAAAIQMLLLWKASGHRMRWRPHPRVWRHFISTGAYVFLTAAMMTLGSQGDYALLGHFHTALEVGIYFFAFNFSAQINTFLWTGFSSVLFPLMSSINDDARRLAQAFKKTVGTIAVFIVPLCVLQAAVAGSLIKLLFAAKWLAAVPLIQLMSIGIGLHTIAEPCVPLLQAQGRFRDLLRYTSVWVVLLLPCIYFAAKFGNALTVAGTIAGFYAIASPIYFYFVIHKLDGRIRDVAAIYLPSACASLIAGAVAVWISSTIGLGALLSLVVTTTIFLVGYVGLIAVLAPEMTRNAVVVLGSQLRRLSAVATLHRSDASDG